jgi:hypothetical protein
MLKRDKNFRITKSVKRTMATMTDQNKMHQYKNLMITASILGSAMVKNKKDKNEKEAD